MVARFAFLLGVVVLSFGAVDEIGALPAAEKASKCAMGNRPAPGSGPLEWQPDPRKQVVITGFAGAPVIRSGNTLVLSNSARDFRRHGLVAVDLRTGQRLAFKVGLPPGNLPLALAASRSTVYVVYGSDGAVGPKGVRAFSLKSGAPLARFRVTEFDDEGTVFSGIAYAKGRVVIAGGPGTGAGGIVAGYNPTTGAQVWRNDPGWAPQGLVTDGSRVFVGVPKLVADERMAIAYDAANGKVVPGWGSAIKDDFDTEAKGIAGSSVIVWSTTAARTHTFLYSRASGKPVARPRTLDSGGEYLFGTEKTIVGVVKGEGRGRFGVYDSRGKVIGTFCFTYVPVAQLDDRTVIAYQSLDNGDTRLHWLRRP